ncbi:hypothetical protein D8B26_007097 [Coccidioides posadasii str. Silveira]|uniref:Uncharacterized protein n=3 Tax=Coccidioides posadasii TaxID=199306 RepID=E9D484_COCPS|nr:C2H2 type zinc finger containing protein [Coccidioides posadasii C735 delta SOWgp]EER29849.1 C2H2 type zinc finger containing protein [Coccidioides posadasii C735 delta SOWgp]EFW18876.1 conserved hypothetical protein [Coccidioides posadasii str. Silveira]KMM71219.1 specific RNA polymerase II transcription factor [Coccidioides posadasii RMSCC 3488]QVM12470.1 hypothetical protein D8B26_007097 [Coccidioides posadasii str. Silveira]|eukprot:XP_003071994.1 C2H2 type zinc finger containing protein [Coccidioides posadasii C735 delta SOWgp]
MGAAFDALSMQQSLGQRRPASATFPSFELPNPQAQQSSQPKHPLHSSVNAGQPTIGGVKVGNLLTPPENSTSDTPGQVQPYSQAYWPTASYSLAPGRNTSHSSAMPDSLAPSYGQNAVYPSPLSPSPALSASSAQQQAHDQQQPQSQSQQPPQHPPQSHQPPMAQSYTNPTSGPIQPQSASQANHLDPYGQKYAYGGSQHSPTPSNYNLFQSGPSSVHPSSSSASSARVPGMPVPYPLDTQQPLPQFTRPYPSYSLPAMNGPVMSNIHSPNNQMALIGSMQPNLLPGFSSGHAASLHHVYSGHPHPHAHHFNSLVPPPQNDRPFRCDLCPQSFNRNHDLKRHKRIHLAVKPFPCHHCDKSFSRKDALKRHILVKGCGKDPASDTSTSSSTTRSTSASVVGTAVKK